MIGTNKHLALHPVADAEGLAEAALSFTLAALPAERPFTIAVSGGATPRELYRRLARSALHWSNGVVTLVDERLVPPDHAESNEAMVRENLLQGGGASARFVGLWSPVEDPKTAAIAAERKIADLTAPFDLVVLGMGKDGHVASLFPGAEGLEAALHPHNIRNVVALVPPTAPHTRLTMTRARLLRAARLLLLIAGAEKRRIVEAAMCAPDALRWPVAVLFGPAAPPLDIIWSRE
jgi:6-phosphogluconolactonase